MKAKTRKQKLTQQQIDAALANLAEVQQEIKDRCKVKEELVRFRPAVDRIRLYALE